MKTRRSYPNSPVSKACSTFDSLTASSTSPLMQLSSPIADTIATAAAVNGTTPQSQQQQWRPVLQNGAYHQQQVVYTQEQLQQQMPMIGQVNAMKRKANPRVSTAMHEYPNKMMPTQFISFQHSTSYQQSTCSPQFVAPSSSVMPPSPISQYNGYDGGPVGQWLKQTPQPQSQSQFTRMELRHSVQARRSIPSPNQASIVMSPTDLAVPRFCGNIARSPLTSMPQISKHSFPQQQQMSQQQLHHQEQQRQQSSSQPPPSLSLSSMPTANTPENVSFNPHFPNQAFNYSSAVSFDDFDMYPPYELFDFKLVKGSFDIENEATVQVVKQLLS